MFASMPQLRAAGPVAQVGLPDLCDSLGRIDATRADAPWTASGDLRKTQASATPAQDTRKNATIVELYTDGSRRLRRRDGWGGLKQERAQPPRSREMGFASILPQRRSKLRESRRITMFSRWAPRLRVEASTFPVLHY